MNYFKSGLLGEIGILAIVCSTLCANNAIACDGYAESVELSDFCNNRKFEPKESYATAQATCPKVGGEKLFAFDGASRCCSRKEELVASRCGTSASKSDRSSPENGGSAGAEGGLAADAKSPSDLSRAVVQPTRDGEVQRSAAITDSETSKKTPARDGASAGQVAFSNSNSLNTSPQPRIDSSNVSMESLQLGGQDKKEEAPFKTRSLTINKPTQTNPLSLNPNVPPPAQPEAAAAPKPESKTVAAPSEVGGGTPSGDSGKADAAEQAAAAKGDKYDSQKQITNSDACKNSTQINSRYSCDTTNTIVKGAVIVDQVGQQAGNAAVGFMGQSKVAKAQEAGTQESAVRGAADVTKLAAQKDIALGVVNTGLGLVQLGMGMKHKGNAKKFDRSLGNMDESSLMADQYGKVSAVAGGGSSAPPQEVPGGDKPLPTQARGPASGGDMQIRSDTIYKFQMNSKYNVEKDLAAARAQGAAGEAQAQAIINKKKTDVSENMRNIGSQASGEQAKTASAAIGGGTMSAIKGIGQLVSGMLAMQAAKDMNKAADNLAESPGGAPYFNPYEPVVPPGQLAPPGFNPNADTFAQRQNPTISANTSQLEAAAEEEQASGPDTGLGPPLSLGNPNNPNGNGPPPAKMEPGSDKGTSSGGSGIGGGTTSAANDSASQEPQAQAAMTADGGRYESGGGGRRGGGGGEDGPDLSKLLEQFLPKKEDVAQNGIEQYGARGPASENDSLLGKDTDIFKRIHEAYQEKHRRGMVR